MSARQCRIALERLGAELVEELGAGYQRSERYCELLTNTGEPATDRERTLVASYRELVATANAILDAHDAQRGSDNNQL